MIVAVPSATEVTSPVEETVADSWDVAPSEATLRLVAKRVIEVATGVGVEVGAVGVSSLP